MAKLGINGDAQGFKLFGTRILLEAGAGKEEVKKTEEDTLEKRTVAAAVAALPCPRCNSADTKFCYFNNYNVNQPRHFCRACQRYWTAGGTIRNVPVGAGRRKARPAAGEAFIFTCSDWTTVGWWSGAS
ncbi:unnamed protein product [Spirodela intermedia]|uniref:Dof-type domain-containing protein n=2 Tax=Spirodela intermedia TaxID=51605 RepID=A0A7I8KX59_SPIIN|nr:unnamed protein product [Spirodela intermedia]CAA6665617.1 unnamed protein product [Spirodela intermedia]CAA7402350.1 unnamed protein product [Spirodela intermedia]